jgi:hypothetical protein
VPDVELRTALTLAECRERLRRAAAALEDWQPDEPIVVSMDGDRVTAADASDSGGPRLLRRWLHAEILDDPAGARLRGRFRLAAPARLALGIWFGSMSAVILLLALATALSEDGDLLAGVPAWVAIATPLLMVAIAIALVRWGLAQSARREQTVVDHLARLLE